MPWSALFRMKGYITRGRRFAKEAEVEAYLREVCAPFGPLTDEQWRHLARHGARRVEGHYELRYDPAIGKPSQVDTVRDEMASMWEEISSLAVPTLLVKGGDSPAVSPEALLEWRRRQPDVRVEVVAGAGHSVQSANPIELARLIESFLSQ